MISIDKTKVYTVDDYSYKNYVLLTEEEKQLVLDWRNHPEIRKWMTNSDIISKESHWAFIEKLKTRTDAYYWLVFKEGVPIGSVDFVNIDYNNNTCISGFYMAPNMLDSGEGIIFHYYYKDLAYSQLGVDALVGGYVEVGNNIAFAMASFFSGNPVGYFEENGKRFLELKGTKEDFNAIDKSHLIRDFARFSRQCRNVDWDKMIMIAKQK